jgi:tetratricopeptide (TPR) repeat protein
MLKIYFGLIISLCIFGSANYAAAQTADQNTTALKFDQALRDDFMKGQAGDAQAFAKAMEASEKIIAASPNDALALVWHGSGMLSQSGKFFGSGDFRQGSEFWKAGLAQMDSAVKTDPANIEVLLTRGATYLAASAQFPVPEESLRLLNIAVGDYEKVIVLGGTNFGKMPEAVRSQTLYGLGEGYRRLDYKAKAREFYLRLLEETKTKNANREKAVQWLGENAG